MKGLGLFLIGIILLVFPSPCGDLVVKEFVKSVVRCYVEVFPSPCGDLVVKDTPFRKQGWRVFQWGKSTQVYSGVKKVGCLCNKNQEQKAQTLTGYSIDRGERSYAVFKDQRGCVDELLQTECRFRSDNCQSLDNIYIRGWVGGWATQS